MSYFDGVRYANDDSLSLASKINPEYAAEIKRHLVVLKARQIGWSWLLANYALWMAITKDAATILMFSKGEKECWELLGKVVKIWDNLPPFLKIKRTTDSKEEQTYTNGSTIKAFAATVSAGVGEAASLVIADEWEYHPFARQNFTNAKPTIDSSGGQWISVFTVNKLDPTTFAKSMFQQAYYDETGEFKALFNGYQCRPGRDEKWYADKMASIPPDELEGLSPELYMLTNYPRTPEEALAPVQSIAAFDLQGLDSMKNDCRPPLDLREKYPNLNHQYCHIYKDFQMGKTYVAAADTGHGVNKDFSVLGIMDVRTGEIVADIMNNKMPVEDFAYNSLELLKVFRNPKLFPEDNDWGARYITLMLTNNYPNFGHYDTKRQKIGFHSNDATRTDIWGRLMTAINNRQVVIYNSLGLAQFYDIYWNTAHEPTRLEAKPGRHDDYCTMVAILLWAAEKVPILSGGPTEPMRILTYNGTSTRNNNNLKTLTFRR